MLLIFACLAVALVAMVFRMTLHHERRHQLRRDLSTHGPQGSFYARTFYASPPRRTLR